MDRVKALRVSEHLPLPPPFRRGLGGGREEPVVWVFAGDSITHGALHTMGWRDYTELFRERVVWELQRAQDAVINTAFSGFNTQAILEQYDLRVSRFKPDVVFIMIGMNDCCEQLVPLPQFVENLRDMAGRIQADGGLPVMQTTCPVISGKAPGREQNLPAYMDSIRQTAVDMSLPLVDHYAHWEKRTEQVRSYLMSDPFHPNEFGHRAFMQQISRDLGIWDDSSYVCRLFVP